MNYPQGGYQQFPPGQRGGRGGRGGMMRGGRGMGRGGMPNNMPPPGY